jgi:uncharacterized Zn finger protein (UPF0148 family)
MRKAGTETTKWRGLSQQFDGGAVLIYSRCHGCDTFNIVSEKGVVIECTFCHRTYQEGETAQEYQSKWQLEEQRKREALEAIRKDREKRINDIKTRMKTNPEVRAIEYLEHLRKGGFPSKAGLSNKAHIYVLKLNKPQGKYWSQHRFPNDEFPVIVNPDSKECKGFVYVGHTQRVPNPDVDLKKYNGDPVLYRFYDEHIAGEGNNSPVVTNDHFSKDFETCGRELTERFGFRNVSITKPTQGEVESYKLESWVGYMLYKLGYWVWGPHAHHADRKDEYGDFLGKGIYL